jgi:hypothetical protein
MQETQGPVPAVAPFDAKKAKAHQMAWAKHLKTPIETTNSIGMKLVRLPRGAFDMGSSQENEATGYPPRQNLPNLQTGETGMVARTKIRKAKGAKKRCIGKPNGQIQERVQALGAGCFGLLAVDCATGEFGLQPNVFYGFDFFARPALWPACLLTPQGSLFPECFSPIRYLLEPLQVLPVGATSYGAGFAPAGIDMPFTAH